MFAASKDPETAARFMQVALERASEWRNKWSLKIFIGKTEDEKYELGYTGKLKVNGKDLVIAECSKTLRVYPDKKLR